MLGNLTDHGYAVFSGIIIRFESKFGKKIKINTNWKNGLIPNIPAICILQACLFNNLPRSAVLRCIALWCQYYVCRGMADACTSPSGGKVACRWVYPCLPILGTSDEAMNNKSAKTHLHKWDLEGHMIRWFKEVLFTWITKRFVYILLCAGLEDDFDQTIIEEEPTRTPSQAETLTWWKENRNSWPKRLSLFNWKCVRHYRSLIRCSSNVLNKTEKGWNYNNHNAIFSMILRSSLTTAWIASSLALSYQISSLNSAR